jgi:hypothetical protein
MGTEQTSGQPSKAKGILGTVLAGAAAVFAFIVTHASEHLGQMSGEWLGSALFIPLVLVFLCCWGAGKLLGPAYDDLKLAIGVTSAQTILHLFAALYLGGGYFMALLPDILILGGGTAWLVLRPGIWPIVLLLAFESFALLMNALTLFQGGFEIAMVKGLISTVLVRAAAIMFLVAAFKSRRGKAAEPAKDTVPAG